MSLRNSSDRGRFRWWSAPLLALWLGLAVVGCDSLIDVENPNNVLDEDIRTPTGAGAVARGALFTVQDGWDDMLGPYSVVSDEAHWVGSRDAWQELDLGTPDNPFNEFTDDFFRFFAQGRWMADEAISILTTLDADGELTDRTLLAEAYFYAAIIYTSIADWMDDFTLSDRKEAGPPIGPDNMGGLYDTALGYLNSGLGITSSGDMGRDLTAMKARVQHAKAVWNMIGRIPISVTNNGLVADAGAAGDAVAALGMDATDWAYQFEYTSATQTSDIGSWMNERQEYRFGDNYVNATANDLKAESVKLQDIIDAVPDPRLEQFILVDFQPNDNLVDLTVVSAREMHLIIAENAAAQAVPDQATFLSAINTLRSWGGVSDWTAAGPTMRDMIIHERRVNLFLQGRRLNDMYRFGIQSDQWQPTRPAATTPGTFLPITIIEIRANCHLSPDFSCPS